MLLASDIDKCVLGRLIKLVFLQMLWNLTGTWFYDVAIIYGVVFEIPGLCTSVRKKGRIVILTRSHIVIFFLFCS
jgi:hypothetical protein